jgi:hypothetical protein
LSGRDQQKHPASPHLKDDVSQIADALIIGNERDPHWTDSARILVHVLIRFTLTLPHLQCGRGDMPCRRKLPDVNKSKMVMSVLLKNRSLPLSHAPII